MVLENIVIDINQRNYGEIQSIQYDANGRYVNVKIVGGGKTIDLTNYLVSIACKKPDGKIVFNETEMVNAKQGIVRFKIAEQISAVLGEVMCEFKIYGQNNSVLTTQYFTIKITEPILEKSIQSSNEFRQLTIAMNNYNDWISKVESKYNTLEKTYAKELTMVKEGLNKTSTQVTESDKLNASNFTDVRNHIAQLSQEKMGTNAMISIQQINKSSGKIDETYLSDDLLQKIAGNAPVHAVPADGSLTPIKNAYPTLIGKFPNENLLNTVTITKGKYVWYQDGELYALANYNATDFIPVVGGQKIESNYHEQTAFYDSNKGYILGVTGIGNGGVDLPSNVNYIKMSVRDDQLDKCIITQEVLPVFDYTPKPRLSSKNLLGQCNLIASQESKIKIVDGKATFVNFTLFEYINKYYIQLNGTYNLTGQGMLILNPINKDVKVCDFHSTYKTYQENYIPLLIGHNGLYSSPILESSQIINLDYDRSFIVTPYKATGHYTSIKEAINDIKQINTNDEFILHIRSGVYNEYLDLSGVNNISLIGEEMESTIIYNHNANYYKAPLTTNGSGTFENLTFMSTSEQAESGVLTSYAMHYEGEPTQTNLKECIFRNCRFKSDNNSAVGIGLRSDETIIFDNCEFIKTSVKPYASGAFYCHCSQFNGHDNQNIIIKDCTLTSDNEYTFQIDDSNSIPGIGENGNVGGEMVITFINVNAWCKNGKGDDTLKLVGTPKQTPNSLIGSIDIHPRSYGNNIAKLNK